MKTTSYNWLSRLVNKITKTEQSNNDSFEYYGHSVTIQSGTPDYMAVYINDIGLDLSFDFLTKELVFSSYEEYEQRNAIYNAFKKYYGRVSVEDEPWEEEKKYYEPMLDNDDYDQDEVKKEYNELMNNKL